MRRFIFILILSTFLVLLPVIANALSYDQVSQIAREITIIIDGCTSGSGVMYERKGNIYSVLTAKHVLNNASGCFVITHDKVRQPINANITIPVSGMDLAVLQFTSNKKYRLAEFGNSLALAPGKTVYVAGAPEPSQAIPRRTLLVTPGSIVGIQEPQNGYSLIYNNATRRGMSGGAVLNDEGKVIGIHGEGDEQDGSKVGLNLGIPIKLFLDAPKSIPAPATIKPSPKISPYLSPNKPLPANPNKRIAKKSQPQNHEINVQKYPYDSLTVEERKKRVETCNDWLGNSSSDPKKVHAGHYGITLWSFWLLIMAFCIFSSIFSILKFKKYKMFTEIMTNFVMMNCIPIIGFIIFFIIVKSINIFISQPIYLLLFIVFGIFKYKRIHSYIKQLDNINFDIISIPGAIGMFLFIFCTIFNLIFVNFVLTSIGNIYCRPFGYSQWLG